MTMAKSKAERDSDLIEESTLHFDMAYKSQQEVRLKCLQDRRFVFVEGAMWEDALKLQFDNKPRFEVNKLHMSCVRIFNEYRNNRISVQFLPSDGDADKETSSFLQGKYRADERDGGGQEAYDNCFEEGVAGGMGAIRLRNVYTDEYDEEDDTQKIVFEPIYDADSSVFFSLDGKKYDKSDAKRCWVITAVARDEYEDKYGETNADYDPFNSPGSGANTFRKVQHMTEFDWFTPDVVYVAEYYKVEETKKRVHVFRLLNDNKRDVKVDESDLDEDTERDMKAQGYTKIRVRTMKQRRVHKWVHDGGRVLEDEGFIAGRNIPVIPFYGKRAYIDNQERIMSHIRLGKDSARLFNMLVSFLAMLAAESPRQKPIFTPEQIAGHQMTWAEDNIKNNPYLLINPITDINGSSMPAGPIAYTKPPDVPQALASLIEVISASIQEVTGNQEAGEKMLSNVSDALVERVQNKVDMQAFIYMDNFGKTMTRCGEVWLDMAREIYDEEGRQVNVIGKDDTRSLSSLKMSKMVDGVAQTVNDPSKGKYLVEVDVGPAFKSARDATVRSLVGMLQFIQDPQLASIITSLILANMDGEGLDDLQEYLRMKLVSMGVVQPTEAEKEKLAQQQQEAASQPPDAQTQYFLASAQHEQAKAGESHATTIKTLADAANSRADAIAKLAGARRDDLMGAFQILQTLISQTGEDAAAASTMAPGATPPMGQPQQAPAMATA
jgi:hypothetical protein